MAKRNSEADLDEHGLPRLISTATITYLAGISSERLAQLVRDNRISSEVQFARNAWHTTAALKEILGYYRRQMDRAKPTADLDIERQSAVEDLRAKRLKNARQARELLPRYVYVQSWGELLNVFKNRWLNFADKMAPRVFRAKDKVEATEILQKEVADIFAGLQDPSIMDDIASKIRDDEFDAADSRDSAGPAGDPEEAGPDLVPPNA